MAKGKQYGLNVSTLRELFLYPDGHAVALRVKVHPEMGPITYIHLYEKLGPTTEFEGQHLHLTKIYDLEGAKGLANLLLSVNHVKATVSAGGNTIVELINKDWNVELAPMDSVQLVDGVQTFSEVKDSKTWRGYTVAKVFPAGARQAKPAEKVVEKELVAV